MVKQRRKFPEVGELVVAQVEAIERMYIYVRLEDFTGTFNADADSATDPRARGMVHISELANRWIRNISNFAKVNQRLVLKVLRVDEDKGHIDLSLRRVNKEQKASQMNEWKYEVKAENLLKIFGEKHDMTLDEVYDAIGWDLVDKYGDAHHAFESIKQEGRESLDEFDLEDEHLDDLFEQIDSSVTIHRISIEGEFEMIVYEGQGVEVLKEAIEKAKKIKKEELVDFEFHYIGAPYYKMKITAKDYPTAEKHLAKIKKNLRKVIEKHDGVVNFERTD